MSMWKFVIGAKPPQPKRKQTSEEHNEYLKEYEVKHRKLSFHAKWKINWPWLQIEQKEGQMITYGDFCITFGTDKTTFIKGCESLQLESIKKHEASNTHVL